ncbi:IS66 family transposase [Bradyrhizobium sp. CCGB20]|nr:IS66 family transposase [Bradyrhizobium sp. CCGB20]
MISSGSTLAEDIRYALNHWQGLTRFLEDGRLELDRHQPGRERHRPACLIRKMRSSRATKSGQKTGPCWRRSSLPQAQLRQPGCLHRRNTRGDHRRLSP